MRFRLEWLATYLPGELPSPSTLRKRLTEVGFNVEGVEISERAIEDTVLEVEVTANRPDGMNHRGLAREAALALSRPFRDAVGRQSELVTDETWPLGRAIPDLARVRIDEPALCPRYSAMVIEDLRTAEAPARVRERLAALGAGSISGPVDATNHVLWDVGQPLHAFDLDRLAKSKDGIPEIVVRKARVGEALVTLDGVSRRLDPTHLVIADAERAVALAGVMGGLDTAISSGTTRVLLESANFSPSAVRHTARSLGMHTDASHRFERGCDPEATIEGLRRATRLILESCGGSVARGILDMRGHTAPSRNVTLRLGRLREFLGMDVSYTRCLEILGALGFAVEAFVEGDSMSVTRIVATVPSWRVDVALEADLIEEIIRHVGYTNLPETLPPPFNPTHRDPVLSREERARDFLVGAGLIETQSYSFVSREENAPFWAAAPGDAPVEIENALGEPFTTLRATPVIGLLRAAQHNLRRGFSELSLFEIGRSFAWTSRPGGDPKTSLPVAERRSAAFLLAGSRGVHWSETESSGRAPRSTDFFDGSGLIASLFLSLGAPAPRFERPTDDDSLDFLKKGQAARVVGADGAPLGWVGFLSDSLASSWDLPDVLVAEVDLGVLMPPPPPTSVEAPPRFPGSEVDLTATHRVGMAWETLAHAVTRERPPELAGVDAKDRYSGPGAPQGFVKTTLCLRFGSADRSLSREEVKAWRDDAATRLLALDEVRVDGFDTQQEEELKGRMS